MPTLDAFLEVYKGKYELLEKNGQDWLDVGTCDGTWDGINRLQAQLSKYFVTVEV